MLHSDYCEQWDEVASSDIGCWKQIFKKKKKFVLILQNRILSGSEEFIPPPLCFFLHDFYNAYLMKQLPHSIYFECFGRNPAIFKPFHKT